jgi:5-methylcytosine-specific restriction endonuclease McrA
MSNTVDLEKAKANRSNPEYEAYLQSERWQKLRRAVKLRARGKCEVCQRRNGTDLAHLTYERIFHEPMTDLLWLCWACHAEVDGRRS